MHTHTHTHETNRNRLSTQSPPTGNHDNKNVPLQDARKYKDRQFLLLVLISNTPVLSFPVIVGKKCQHKTVFPVASMALTPTSRPTPEPPAKTICGGGTTLIGTDHRSTFDFEGEDPVDAPQVFPQER